jgi:S-DNA-T family DNA segregation ATPase FtsK/SpoIIIE
LIFRRIIIAIKKVNTDNQPVKILSNFLGFGLIGFSIYILISLISYNAADSAYFYQTNDPNVMNLGGPLGAVVSDILLSTIGLGSYLLLLFISLWSLESLAPKIFNLTSPKFLFRIIGGLLSLICFTALCEFYIAGQSFPQGSSGGFIGKFIFSNLVLIFGLIGSLLFLIIFLIPSATLGLNISWPLLFTYAGRLLLKISSLARLVLENIFKFLEKLFTTIFQGLKNLIENIKDIQRNKQIEPSKTKPLISASKKSPEIKAVPKTQSVINLKNDKPEDKVDLSKSDMAEDKEPVTKMPSTELLDRALDDGESLSKEDLESLSELLEIKLDEFGIEAEVVSVLPGPVVTRFEIQPAPGTKANKITNIAQDIARSLAVSSVRVVEVIEGKSVVGIEIPNTNRKMVRLKEILASSAFEDSKSHLSLALGKDIAGKAVVVNLEKMPHLLVAGTTGSGKSVGINAMLLSLLFKSDPEDVRLILIDPKMLELSVYDGIPHLLTPVITDMSDAANGLRWCVAEMDRRYKLMSAMGVRNLSSFNTEAAEKGESIQNPLKEDEEDFLEELPSIVVVVDEFADMMMLVGKKVEHLIARIAQKARAAGIHLILATQRPSVDVITGLIKANIPTRISFQVSTKIDSRTVLDQGGAEQLLGYGDMLYLPAGQGVPARVHGAFVGDDEVHRVVDDWKKRGTPDFVDEITSDLQDTGPIPGWSNSSGASGEEDDELYDEAVNFVIESRRASISAVQRKLRIGYNRAARLIESMEAAGLVSEMSSNGSREVLVPKRN